MRFNENVKKGTIETNRQVERANEQTNEQMGHISLKFMRFKLMRINQNGIRFNFNLNCSAVYSFFCACFCCWWRSNCHCYCCCCCCCCFCICNEFIFGVGSFGAPKMFEQNKKRRNVCICEREIIVREKRVETDSRHNRMKFDLSYCYRVVIVVVVVAQNEDDERNRE